MSDANEAAPTASCGVMASFTPAIVETNENGATNPRTGKVLDRFLLVRFATGQRTVLHDHGIIGFTPTDSTSAADILVAIMCDHITSVLHHGENVDLLLHTHLMDPSVGQALPAGWTLHMDLSGEDDARLACRIIDPLWRASSASGPLYRAAYPTLYETPHILVESDIGRFIITLSRGHGERHSVDADLRPGDYLWWTGYQRFVPYAFI